MLRNLQVIKIMIFFKLVFTSCKAEQPLRDMESYKKKKHKKVKAYRESI